MLEDMVNSSTWCSSENQITIDLPGRVTGATTDSYLLTGSLGQQSTTAISIDYILEILPEVEGTQRCSETTTPAICTEECAFTAVQKQCGCSPGGTIRFDNSNAKNIARSEILRLDGILCSGFGVLDLRLAELTRLVRVPLSNKLQDPRSKKLYPFLPIQRVFRINVAY